MPRHRRGGPGRVLPLLLLLILFIPAAAAQENATSAEDDGAVIAIDQATTVEDMTWSGGTVDITFSSDIPRVATVTDVNSITSSGASEVRFKRVRIAQGRTTVSMQAASGSGGSRTVTVAVGESMVALSNPTTPLLETAAPRHVGIGAITGASMTILLAAGVIWIKKRREQRVREVKG